MADDDKLKEFRDNNLKLMQQLDELTKARDALAKRFEGFDPAVAATERAELERFRNAKPDEKIAALEAQVTQLRSSADAAVIRSTIADSFIRAGGHPNAVDFIVSKAREVFTVDNGALVGKTFDPAKPGEKLTPEAFMSLQIRESAFAFKPSSGGGANPTRGGGGSADRQLINPSPTDLGKHADAIARGDLKVVYTI